MQPTELTEMCVGQFDSLGKQDITVHLGDEAWELFATQCDLWSAERRTTSSYADPDSEFFR